MSSGTLPLHIPTSSAARGSSRPSRLVILLHTLDGGNTSTGIYVGGLNVDASVLLKIHDEIRTFGRSSTSTAGIGDHIQYPVADHSPLALTYYPFLALQHHLRRMNGRDWRNDDFMIRFVTPETVSLVPHISAHNHEVLVTKSFIQFRALQEQSREQLITAVLPISYIYRALAILAPREMVSNFIREMVFEAPHVVSHWFHGLIRYYSCKGKVTCAPPEPDLTMVAAMLMSEDDRLRELALSILPEVQLLEVPGRDGFREEPEVPPQSIRSVS